MLAAEVDSGIGFIQNELAAALPEGTITTYLKEEPGLELYSRADAGVCKTTARSCASEEDRSRPGRPERHVRCPRGTLYQQISAAGCHLRAGTATRAGNEVKIYQWGGFFLYLIQSPDRGTAPTGPGNRSRLRDRRAQGCAGDDPGNLLYQLNATLARLRRFDSTVDMRTLQSCKCHDRGSDAGHPVG